MGTRRAFSLAEAVVGAALASTLLALVVLVLVPLSRSTVRATDQGDLRRIALTTLEILSADLSSSAAAGLEAKADPLVVSIHPLVGLTADGAQIWADYLIVWAHDGGNRRLLRAEARAWPPSPSKPSRPPLTLLPSLAQGGRVAAVSVSSLTVEGLSPGRVTAPLRLTLALERGSTRGPERFTLTTTVGLRQKAGRSVKFTP